MLQFLQQIAPNSDSKIPRSRQKVCKTAFNSIKWYSNVKPKPFSSVKVALINFIYFSICFSNQSTCEKDKMSGNNNWLILCGTGNFIPSKSIIGLTGPQSPSIIGMHCSLLATGILNFSIFFFWINNTWLQLCHIKEWSCLFQCLRRPSGPFFALLT
jgi:hypothetical protein